MPALAQPVCLQIVIAPHNVGFCVALNIPWLNEHDVAGAHPDVAPYFARDAAHSFLAVFALHLQAPSANGLNYGAKHLTFAGQAHANRAFWNRPAFSVPALPAVVSAPSSSSSSWLWHIFTLFCGRARSARLAHKHFYSASAFNYFCIRAGAFVAYNICFYEI